MYSGILVIPTMTAMSGWKLSRQQSLPLLLKELFLCDRNDHCIDFSCSGRNDRSDTLEAPYLQYL